MPDGPFTNTMAHLATTVVMLFPTRVHKPTHFAVTTPTGATDIQATNSMLGGGVNATSPEKTTTVTLRATRKRATLHGKGWFEKKVLINNLLTACHKGQETYTCKSSRIEFAFSYSFYHDFLVCKGRQLRLAQL